MENIEPEKTLKRITFVPVRYSQTDAAERASFIEDYCDSCPFKEGVLNALGWFIICSTPCRDDPQIKEAVLTCLDTKIGKDPKEIISMTPCGSTIEINMPLPVFEQGELPFIENK